MSHETWQYARRLECRLDLLLRLSVNLILEVKELSVWNKIKYLNLNIFRTRWCKPLIFQTQIIWSNRIHSLKYLRSATFGSKDTVSRKSEFVAKTQFLYKSICQILEKIMDFGLLFRRCHSIYITLKDCFYIPYKSWNG